MTKTNTKTRTWSKANKSTTRKPKRKGIMRNVRVNIVHNAGGDSAAASQQQPFTRSWTMGIATPTPIILQQRAPTILQQQPTMMEKKQLSSFVPHCVQASSLMQQ
jgi:hypothetical protein